MRSLLLVPVADAVALEAAFRSEADVVVLDLAAAEGATVRQAALDGLRASRENLRPDLYLRVADLDGPSFDGDLAALLAGEPDGILLAGARTGADIQHLGAKLAAGEAEHGLVENAVGIVAEVGHAAGLFGLGSYAGASSRLLGLAWDAAGLAADLGSDADLWPRADFAPFETVRHLTLFAARAAGVAAIDTASGAPTDDAFLAECRRARQQGFNAKLATTPAQAAIINAVFGHEDA